MVGWYEPTALFFGFATLLQWLLAVLILWRRGRVESMVVLALLFAFNGAQSLGAWLSTGLGVPVEAGRDGFLNRLFFVCDFTTTALIAYLALAYPRRPAVLASRPFVLPLLFGTYVAFVLVAFATQPLAQLFVDCAGGACTTWFSFIAYAGIPDLAFPLLLLRWTHLLLEEASPPRRREFQWIFAAFAMRGAHVSTAFPLDNLVSGFFQNNPPLWYAVYYGFVTLGSILVVLGCIGYFLAVRPRLATERHRSVDTVLLFLVLGVATTLVGGFVNLDPSVSETYFLDPLNSFDFLVVRPTLIVVAFLHTEVFGPLLDPRRTGAILTGGVSFALFLPTLLERLPQIGAARIPAAAFLAATLSLLLAFVARRLLRTKGDSVEQRAIGQFVNLLEDTYRRGTPTAAEAARIDEERVRLGIPKNQAEALIGAVQERWTNDPSRDWLPRDRILGRYTLEKLLGEGGMGQAWLAIDQLTNDRVVLKRTKNLDPVLRRSLLQEAAALERLSHDHIIRILRTEVVGREPIVVMEYASGGSLATLLQEQPLTRLAKERLSRELLSAVSAAHARAIVHGDLKPQNVLLDEQGLVRLSDFGLAAQSVAPSSLETMTSASPQGSLRYLAPEQIGGQRSTPASDQYALGLILCEIWSGRHPIPDGLGDFETRQRILRGARVPARVPVAYRAVLQRMLATDPRRRFGSVSEVHRALEDPARATTAVGAPNGTAEVAS